MGAGYAVFSINYKLMCYGDASRGIEKRIVWPRNFYDCKTALRFLRKYSRDLHICPDRIAVMGESAGGHLALLTAYTAGDEALNKGGAYTEQSNTVSAVVNLYGITDVHRWHPEAFYDERTPDPAREVFLASPLSHVCENSPPTLTLHGNSDQVVPFDHAERLRDMLDRKSVKNIFIEVDGGIHAFLLTPHEANAQANLVPPLLDFLDRHL